MITETVERGLKEFVSAAREVFAEELRSVVLFGSAAEERLRASSDVNVMVVLARFEAEQARRLGPALEAGRAAIRLQAMFVLEEELGAAAEAFAAKFGDIARRHRVLWGAELPAAARPPREAMLANVRQTLLNLAIRLRQQMVRRASHPDELAVLAAETAGPLRAAAATLVQLEGGEVSSGKEALEKLVKESGNAAWEQALVHISRAREERVLTADAAQGTVDALLECAVWMRERAAGMSR